MNFYRKDWILYQEIANEGGNVPQELLTIKSKTGNPDEEKHVPFIKETKDGYLVKIGKKMFHATDKNHHTIFIDLAVDGKYYYRQYIPRDGKPEAVFHVPKGKKVEAFAFCSLHGLWTYNLK